MFNKFNSIEIYFTTDFGEDNILLYRTHTIYTMVHINNINIKS